MSACSICTHNDLDMLEELGRRAQSGDISWRAAVKEGGIKSHVSLKTHMENHVLVREEKVARDELGEAIERTINELVVEMESALPLTKPLYLVAIQNLRELRNTKPSQQHLIMALKSVQELTGMRQEQRLMLQFAEAMFREVEPAPQRRALAVETIDAEVVE